MRIQWYLAFCLLMVLFGDMLPDYCFGQEKQLKWQRQLDSLRTKVREVNDSLSLEGFMYKGEINSIRKALDVLDSIFSPESKGIRLLEPKIEVSRQTVIDTFFFDENTKEGLGYIRDSSVVIEREIPQLEIVQWKEVMGEVINKEVMGRVMNKVELERELVLTKYNLLNEMGTGAGYAELIWRCKGEQFKTWAIIANDERGIIFDIICSQMLSKNGTERSVVKFKKLDK